MIRLIPTKVDHGLGKAILICEIVDAEELAVSTKAPFHGGVSSALMKQDSVTLVNYEVARVLENISSIPIEELLTSDTELLREIGKRIQGGQ